MSLADKYAAEHKRFLEEHNPAVLRGQSDPTSYLSSVGETAAEMFWHLMRECMQRVRDLPHMEKVRELESRRHEVEELIRHDLIFHATRQVSDRGGDRHGADDEADRRQARGPWLSPRGELPSQTSPLGFEEEAIRAQQPTGDQPRGRDTHNKIRKRVIAGPSRIDGGVSRIVEFADGSGKIGSWNPGVGWVEGGASFDEFIGAAPVSPKLARRLGIPLSEL